MAYAVETKDLDSLKRKKAWCVCIMSIVRRKNTTKNTLVKQQAWWWVEKVRVLLYIIIFKLKNFVSRIIEGGLIHCYTELV